MIAFLIPLARDLLCLVKKLTVIGIIGKTQGVNKAAKPLKKAKKKMVNNDLSVSLSVDSFTGVFSVLSSFSVIAVVACSSVESVLSVSFKTKLISALLFFSLG